MSAAQIVMGCIISVIAVALGVYTFFAAQCKGPILSNSYLFLGKEERKRADKKAEYKLVTVVFGCLAAAFALLALWIFTGWEVLSIPFGVVIAFAVVYAIVDGIKTEVNKNR